jgi:Bacterial aa3 type cytochrome c oxidase subunit IV
MAHNDIKDAKATYDSFIGLTKVSAVVVALITIFVVVLIS